MSSEPWKHSNAAGQAFLFSFPYFLLTKETPPLPVLTGTVGRVAVRLYPPFRSAKSSFIGAPEIDPHKVPFMQKVRSNQDHLATFAVMPTFDMKDRDGQPVKLVHLDSIRVDVTGDVDEDHLGRVAKSFLDIFTKSVRVGCLQWWIGHPYAVFVGDLRNIFSIDLAGMPLDDAHARGMVTTFGGFEHPLDVARYRRAFAAAIADQAPPLVDQMLLDGTLEHFKKDYRKAVLDFAIALEIERDALFERIWGSLRNGKALRRGVAYPGNDLAKHLDSALQKLTGTSLRREQPELWEKLRRFWLLRNEVAHGALVSSADVKRRSDELGDVRKLAFDVARWMRTYPTSLR